MIRNAKNQQGFLLMTAYLMLTVASVLFMAFSNRAFVYFHSVEQNQNQIQAFNFAESGVDTAMNTITWNTAYTGTGYTALGTQGGYSVNVSTMSPEVRLIRSTGFAPNNIQTTPGFQSRTVNAYVKVDSTPFAFAAFGETSLSVDGSAALIDSYNSASGAYGGGNINSNGDLASDGTLVFNGMATHLGDIVQSPNINCSPGVSPVTSSGSLNISGNTVYNLPAGTYYFDSIRISGSAQLRAQGPVTIYVSGVVDIGGNGVGTSANIPGNLLIIATSSGDISVGGNGAFYGGIYAPASRVSNNAGDFFGSVISNEYRHNGASQLHYDEAMSNVSAPCYEVTLLAWNEEAVSNQGR